MITSINPYTGKKIKSYNEFDLAQINRAMEEAQQGFLSWRDTNLIERTKLMLKVSDIMGKRKAEYAELISIEMGKPITQSIAEIEKCAWLCKYYTENTELFLKEEVIETDAYQSYVRYDPLGIILGVMPWNFPFWQVFRFAVPTVLAGNVVLLKHASNVMGCAFLIEEIFKEAGFPKACFQNLCIGSKKVSTIIDDNRVKGVSLTGSKPAGSAVATTAAAQIKPSLLELGGSNALVVLEDANIEESVKSCISARFMNTGQSCIAGKRLLLHKKIEEEFLEKFIAEVEKLKVGDPLDAETYIGVLAKEDLAETLEKQVKESVKMGAKVILGGKRNTTFFEPTILTHVTENMPVFKEETFGPVIGITVFENEKEALHLVNKSNFGLGASIFTEDLKRAKKLIPQVEDGAVFVNSLVKSDPRLPFGGTKISGYGRELSKEGIRAFTNIKTVYINKY